MLDMAVAIGVAGPVATFKGTAADKRELKTDVGNLDVLFFSSSSSSSSFVDFPRTQVEADVVVDQGDGRAFAKKRERIGLNLSANCRSMILTSDSTLTIESFNRLARFGNLRE